jgi:hypothetical protein
MKLTEVFSPKRTVSSNVAMALELLRLAEDDDYNGTSRLDTRVKSLRIKSLCDPHFVMWPTLSDIA